MHNDAYTGRRKVGRTKIISYVSSQYNYKMHPSTSHLTIHFLKVTCHGAAALNSILLLSRKLFNNYRTLAFARHCHTKIKLNRDCCRLRQRYATKHPTKSLEILKPISAWPKSSFLRICRKIFVFVDEYILHRSNYLPLHTFHNLCI